MRLAYQLSTINIMNYFMRNFIRLLLLSIFVGSFISCKPPNTIPMPISSVNTPINPHHIMMTTKASWKAKGKMALLHNKIGHNLYFDLEHKPSSVKLTLSGPFGSERASLTASKDMVKLERSDGRISIAKHLSALLQEVLVQDTNTIASTQIDSFAALELSDLAYWLLGLANPLSPVQAISGLQAPQQGFTQKGWRIEYQSLQTTPWGLYLPKQLLIYNDQVRIKCFINNWSTN